MTDDEIKTFAFQQTPALAANITRLCGKVIERGLTGILEHACVVQQQVMALEAERDALRSQLTDALQVLGMVDKNNRIDAGEKGKAWSGRFVANEVRRVLAPAPDLRSIECPPDPDVVDRALASEGDHANL